MLDVDTAEILSVEKTVEMPQSGSKYVPALYKFEELKIKEYF